MRLAHGEAEWTNGSAANGNAAADHARAVTETAGSSFYWAMRLLPRRQREAMFAIYAFCREVDDIADGDLPDADKRARLDAWRSDIDSLFDGSSGNGGTAPSMTAQALAGPIATFGLARADFRAVIDGMEMDGTGMMVAPPIETLLLYCHRVAGAVGLLSIRVFGAEGAPARDFAETLGTALQLTNILRDLAEDASMGRLYLPAELLNKHGIEARTPADILADPRLPDVCAELAAIAADYFDRADSALQHCTRARLKPALVMMESYRRLLRRMRARGWSRPEQRVRVSKPEKLWIALRYSMW